MSPLVSTAGKPKPRAQAASPAGRAARKPGHAASGVRKGKVAGAKKIVAREVPSFSRQLAAMLQAGMPIVTCLETLEDQAVNPNFKAVIQEVRKNIENGSSLSESMALFPSIFDELFCNMIRGGESSGNLAETIARLASLLEANAKLRRKVKSAMSYPVIVLCIAISIAIGMILFIVPVFSKMYEDFGSALPGPTQFLVDMSDVMRQYSLYIFGGLFAGGFAFKKWAKTPSGGYAVDRFALRAPVVGMIVQKVAVARFARTLSQLIRSGVPILDALDIVSGATGNSVVKAAVLRGRTSVERGDTLSSGLATEPCLPSMMVRMLAAGEKTGKVDEMMDSIADFYEDEVEAMLSGLTSLIEPLLMIFLGVVIGGIVICMFLPIFKLHEVVSM